MNLVELSSSASNSQTSCPPRPPRSWDQGACRHTRLVTAFFEETVNKDAWFSQIRATGLKNTRKECLLSRILAFRVFYSSQGFVASGALCGQISLAINPPPRSAQEMKQRESQSTHFFWHFPQRGDNRAFLIYAVVAPCLLPVLRG